MGHAFQEEGKEWVKDLIPEQWPGWGADENYIDLWGGVWILMQGQQANTKSDKQSNDRRDEEMRLCQFFFKGKIDDACWWLVEKWERNQGGLREDFYPEPLGEWWYHLLGWGRWGKHRLEQSVGEDSTINLCLRWQKPKWRWKNWQMTTAFCPLVIFLSFAGGMLYTWMQNE